MMANSAQPRTRSPLAFALRGALGGLAIATLVAVPILLFSTPPTGIEADAFAAYVGRSAGPGHDGERPYPVVAARTTRP